MFLIKRGEYASILCVLAFANFETLNQCSRRENNTAGVLYFTEMFLVSLQPSPLKDAGMRGLFDKDGIYEKQVVFFSRHKHGLQRQMKGER